MAPGRRGRLWSRPDSASRRRQADLHRLAADVARREFDKRHGTTRLGPVVALLAAYEEEGNIAEVVKGMPTEVAGLELSTLVVVDGGTDRTAEIAAECGAVTCVLPVNLGQGAALRLGYSLASDRGARYVVTLDADGQNDPSEIEGILRPVLDGEADFVIASRRLGVDQTSDRLRQAGVTVYAWAINTIVRQRLSDSSNGYRAFRIEVLDDIVPRLVEDQYQTAEVIITAASRGWRIAQRPTIWHPRASGSSKKGGNLFFGLQYGRVIAQTWFRTLRQRRSGT
jgi:glycosyltransferase involved in cell wall biosynthesis